MHPPPDMSARLPDSINLEAAHPAEHPPRSKVRRAMNPQPAGQRQVSAGQALPILHADGDSGVHRRTVNCARQRDDRRGERCDRLLNARGHS